jgi:cytochrome c peroxidase
MRKRNILLAALLIAVTSVAFSVRSTVSNPLLSSDPSGNLSTISTTGPIDVTTPFFQSLGTNGRTCNSCHVSSNAWTISPAELQARFSATNGTDPVFRTVDGANCPSADVSTLAARKNAYSLLLNKGLIRIAIATPATADFQITDIQDPYMCPETTPAKPAMYRRPLPSTNLPFLTTVMWDGRESPKGHSMQANLLQQAMDATSGHAEGSVTPSAAQLQQIVDFETALYTAQSSGQGLGDLASQGAAGGTAALTKQEFYTGINDVLGADPEGHPFDSKAFTTYDAWTNSPSPQKASVARGQALFNTFPITITGVAGLNDLPGLSTVNGTCTTCHDSPNVGNHSVPLAINIGITDYPAVPALDTSGLPVYTITCNGSSDPIRTTDPGRAMITGHCADIGKTKGPILRGLAARAPYFHNGGAKTLDDAVEFYNQRFQLEFTAQQKKDLVAFLKTL